MVARAELPPHVEVHRHRERLLDQDEVQAELASVLVRQLSRRAGTNLQVAEPFLATIVGQVVDTSAFRTVFDLALSNAHRVLVDRETGTIILNLTSAYDQIKQPSATGRAEPRRRAPEPEPAGVRPAPPLAADDGVGRASTGVKRVVGFLTIAAGLLLVAGVALAVDRWRAVARGAWIVAGAGVVLFVALFGARRRAPVADLRRCARRRGGRVVPCRSRRRSSSSRSIIVAIATFVGARGSLRRDRGLACLAARGARCMGEGPRARCRSASGECRRRHARSAARAARGVTSTRCSGRWRSPRSGCSRSSNRRAWRTCS